MTNPSNNPNLNDPAQTSDVTFEAAFERLEQILEKMHSGSISLDDSLKLYEEADRLICVCSKKLNDAERKIELLIKSRSGELSLGPDGKPLTQDFSPSTQSGNK